MNNFLMAEASWLTPNDPIEPIETDVEGQGYFCENGDCPNDAAVEIQWPLEDHDLPHGFFCQQCLEVVLNDMESTS